jgi:hypothetical protein
VATALKAAYMFRKDGISWVQEAKFVPPVLSFGIDAAISGDRVVVGADHYDGTVSDSGGVYVYRWNGAAWFKETVLTASDATSADYFGRAVAVDGEAILVGAPWSDDACIDDPSCDSGAAYVYRITTGDCNENGILDDCDVIEGTSQDCDGDMMPDECQDTSTDCNANGVWDPCDIDGGVSEDCNINGVPDECDLASGTSADDLPAGGDGIPDECQSDCNGNGVPDDADISEGFSEDCNENNMPDECEPDCNGNGAADSCDLADGVSADCNANGVPDECDITEGTSEDCTDNGIPDECEPDCNANEQADSCDIEYGSSGDCNLNDVPDECDIAGGQSVDCNSNGVPDECDISAGTSQDLNVNGVPDECEAAAPAPEPGGPACTSADDCSGAYFGADCVGGICYVPKNRYLSIDPTINTPPVAYRVEVIESAPYPNVVGRTWWIDEPVCHDYPNGDPVLPAPPSCEGADRFGWVSKLSSVPVSRIWTEIPLHIADCGIVAVVTYQIQASTDGGATVSDPLEIGTAHNPDGETQSWGDITGGPAPGMPGLWLAPERATNLADVGNAIRTFENRAEDTGFPPRVWVDVEIDQVVNLGDVSFIVMAFEGRAYADIGLDLIGVHPADCP